MRMQLFKRYQRVVLFLTFFSFTCVSLPHASAQETPNLQDAILNLYKMDLPEDIGSIEQRWKAEGDQMLILIQDSHISLEVQLNIAKIIQLYVDDYNVELVNIEGADHEKIDFDELRNLEPRDVVEKVSVDFLKESRINGAVYAKINSRKDFIQYGTEDKEEYLENYKSYLAVVENNADLLSNIVDVKNTMLKRKEKFVSKKLGQFINLEILFRDGDTALASYFKRLMKNAKKLKIDLTKYPVTYQLLEIALKAKDEEAFKRVDYKTMLDELALIAREVKGKYAKTIKAETFVELLERLLTLEELLKLRIVQTDYELYEEDATRYSPESLSQLIQDLFPERDTQFLQQLPKILKDADDFYRIAHDRSGTLFFHSLENMEAEGKNISVVVSGGYHTEAIVQLCRENEVSFLRVMPKVSSDEATVDYEGRMLALKSELLPSTAQN